MTTKIYFWQKPTIGDIIQIILILSLFVFIMGLKLHGYYDSVYISYNECGEVMAIEKINKERFLQDKTMIPIRTITNDGRILEAKTEWETFKINKSTMQPILKEE